ncbi:MAG: VacJ family lipoprotein [Maricaulaceae bacterium]
MFFRIALSCGAVLLASACATRPPEEGAESSRLGGAARNAARVTTGAVQRAGEGVDQALAALEKPEDGLVADPFEPFNRVMYRFNDGLDRVILGPVAHGYQAVVPRAGRARVRDFIDNWKSPVWFANDVLQGDFEHAGVTARRFALNTTVGVLGAYDFAAHHADLPKRDEDFGQTLGVWGAGNGAYLMLPVLGPTTFRDLTGTVVDFTMDPFTWTEFDGDDTYRITNRALDFVDIRVQTDPALEAIRDSADPYLQARAVYIQSRNERIRNGGQGEEEVYDLPEFE